MWEIPPPFLPWRPIRMILPGARVVSAGGKQAMTPIFQGNPWTIRRKTKMFWISRYSNWIFLCQFSRCFSQIGRIPWIPMLCKTHVGHPQSLGASKSQGSAFVISNSENGTYVTWIFHLGFPRRWWCQNMGWSFFTVCELEAMARNRSCFYHDLPFLDFFEVVIVHSYVKLPTSVEKMSHHRNGMAMESIKSRCDWDERTWRRDASGQELLLRTTDSHLGVSWDGGTRKSSILIGVSIMNYPFLGIPVLGNFHFKHRQLVLGQNGLLVRRIGESEIEMPTANHMKILWTYGYVFLTLLPFCSQKSWDKKGISIRILQRSMGRKMSNSNRNIIYDIWRFP